MKKISINGKSKTSIIYKLNLCVFSISTNKNILLFYQYLSVSSKLNNSNNNIFFFSIFPL